MQLCWFSIAAKRYVVMTDVVSTNVVNVMNAGIVITSEIK